MQYSSTTLLLLVNPHKPHQNNGTKSPSYIFIVWINNYLKRTSEIKVATMKIMDDFHYKWKPSHAYHKIDTFRGEQRWMGHKGVHWYSKSMKNALHVQRYGKRHLSDEMYHSLSHCWVTWVWRYQAGRQLVSYSVSQSVEYLLNIFFNFRATFWNHFGSIWKLDWA